MTKPKVGGYLWRQHLAQALRANRMARRALSRILDEDPSRLQMAVLLALVGRYLAENLDALMQLKEITKE
jgi:hypothetical protein